MTGRRTVEYVECKTLGHAWEEFNPRDGSGLNGWDSRLTLRCTRCTSTRFDFIDYMGELGDRKYWRPDDYRDAKEVKPSRAALRLMMVKR